MAFPPVCGVDRVPVHSVCISRAIPHQWEPLDTHQGTLCIPPGDNGGTPAWLPTSAYQVAMLWLSCDPKWCST